MPDSNMTIVGSDGDLTPYNGASGVSNQRLVFLEPISAEGHWNPLKDSEIVDLWHLFRSRLLLIVLLAIIGGVCGALVTSVQVPFYHAEASMELRSPILRSPIEAGIGVSQPTGQAGNPDAYLHTQVRVLQSRSLSDRAIAKLRQNHKLSNYTPTGRFAKWRKVFGLPVSSKAAADRQVVPEHIDKFSALENTDIINVSCDSPDPKFSADYVNTLTSEYAQMMLEGRWNSAQFTSTWLTQQLQDLKQQLETSEAKLQAYSKESGLLLMDEKRPIQEQALEQVQTTLSAATADRM